MNGRKRPLRYPTMIQPSEFGTGRFLFNCVISRDRMSGQERREAVGSKVVPDTGSTICVSKRVDMDCREAGFSPPPAPVYLKPQHGPSGWCFRVRTVAGKADAVVGWLAQWDPTVVQAAKGVAPTTLRAEFRTLQGPWNLLEQVKVDHMVLIPVGTLSLVIRDEEDRVEGFVQTLGAQVPQEDFRVRPYMGPDEMRSSGLTRRQEEVVSLAVALGYYDVPRKLNLRMIADRLGLSLGATSELIRRGESAIVAGYIDSLIGLQDPGENEFENKEHGDLR